MKAVVMAGGEGTRLRPMTSSMPKPLLPVANRPIMEHVLRLLKRHGLSVDDIDLWELNEAFASQVVYCRDKLGIPSERLNVNGGAISIGHPFGMSGSRMVGHILLEGRRRRAKYGVVTMCVAGGMGCAALIEFQ